jgi:tRNA (cmo5U34)-methyltransferase
MTTPGAAWQRERLVAGFIDERRELIPLLDVQEDLIRRIVTRGGRAVTRFCDLGAGDGAFSELLMEVFPGSTGVLVDFSEPMLAAAESRLGPMRGRWRIVRADLSEREWLDGLQQGERFDAVVSRLCIHHLPDERKRALYEEAFELIEPGGLFLNWEHVAAGGLAEGMFEEIFIERLLEAERGRESPRLPEVVVREYHDAADEDILLDAETQCNWLREIGFEQVDVYFKLPELAIFGGVRSERAVEGGH